MTEAVSSYRPCHVTLVITSVHDLLARVQPIISHTASIGANLVSVAELTIINSEMEGDVSFMSNMQLMSLANSMRINMIIEV